LIVIAFGVFALRYHWEPTWGMKNSERFSAAKPLMEQGFVSCLCILFELFFNNLTSETLILNFILVAKVRESQVL
jgi:hypothetical protein